MKRQFMFGTMLAAVMAVGVGAQQPGQAGSAGQAGQSSSDQSSKSVTVTGCLQSSPSSGAPATGDTTSRQSGSQAQYILTNASTASGTSGSSTGAAGTGTSGATAGSTRSSAGAAKTFRLQGGSSSDMQKYVNSKVEVTGTLASGSERGTTGSATGSATGTGTGSSSTGSATGSTSSSATAGMSGSQTLRVTSVRQVSESCSGGEGR
jgi:hypothetical protein